MISFIAAILALYERSEKVYTLITNNQLTGPILSPSQLGNFMGYNDQTSFSGDGCLSWTSLESFSGDGCLPWTSLGMRS